MLAVLQLGAQTLIADGTDTGGGGEAGDSGRVWEVMVPGGGGCFRAPEISPHDGNLIFGATDMESAFRTVDDGGKSWCAVLFQNPETPGYNVTNSTWLTGAWGWMVAPFAVAADPYEIRNHWTDLNLLARRDSKIAACAQWYGSHSHASL